MDANLKNFLWMLFLIMVCMFVFVGCGYKNETSFSDNSVSSHKTSSVNSNSDISDTRSSSTEAINPGSSSTGDSDTEKVPDIKDEKEMKIKVTDGNNEVVFLLNDSNAAKSLYEQLPLTLEVENYNSNEKIFYPPNKLDTTDAVEGGGPFGSLAYFSPWGNVIMYYSPFGSYPGLYALGIAVEGSQNIEKLSGTISINAVTEG